ncbi:MAG TPA: GNAT family N-acetyltransferase [Candidatus Dormibacteraeota bacterium]
MKVRPASIRDLGPIEDLHRLAGAELSQAPPTTRLWSMLSHSLSSFLPLLQDGLLFVAEEDGEMIGFIQASGRPQGSALSGVTTLQVLNLVVAPKADLENVGAQLLEHLANHAVGRGIERLFVRLPTDEAVIPVFRRLGFHQYATEHVLFSDAPEASSTAVPFGLRPARGDDLRTLYSLYRKITPLGVAQMEVPNFKEWRRLKSEPILRLGRAHTQQFVIDRVELVGWIGVQKASGQSRPHTLSFLALPEAGLPEELADYAVTALGPSPGPAWSSLRHYDSHMIDALRGRGFTTLLNQSLMVKELALRAPLREKALVPSFG